MNLLQVSGNKIVDGVTGKPVRLIGANVVRREWIGGGSYAFEQRAFPALAIDWHANCVVTWISSGPVNRNETQYLQTLDGVVALASQNSLYIILGYRSAEPDGEQPMMPDAAAISAMMKLAGRYRDNPAVLYQLQIEPAKAPRLATWDELRLVFTNMAASIRAASRDAICLVPGTNYARYISGALLLPISGPNIVYTSHPYDHRGEIYGNPGYQLAKVSAKYPVMITEFGYSNTNPNSLMNYEDCVSLMDLCYLNGISWAAWVFDAAENTGLNILSDNDTLLPSKPYGESVKFWMGLADVEPPPTEPGLNATQRREIEAMIRNIPPAPHSHNVSGTAS